MPKDADQSKVSYISAGTVCELQEHKASSGAWHRLDQRVADTPIPPPLSMLCTITRMLISYCIWSFQ